MSLFFLICPIFPNSWHTLEVKQCQRQTNAMTLSLLFCGVSRPAYPEPLEAKTPWWRPQLGSPAMRSDWVTSDTQDLVLSQHLGLQATSDLQVWSTLEGSTWSTWEWWGDPGWMVRRGRSWYYRPSALPRGSMQKQSFVAWGGLVHSCAVWFRTSYDWAS